MKKQTKKKTFHTSAQNTWFRLGNHNIFRQYVCLKKKRRKKRRALQLQFAMFRYPSGVVCVNSTRCFLFLLLLSATNGVTHKQTNVTDLPSVLLKLQGKLSKPLSLQVKPGNKWSEKVRKPAGKRRVLEWTRLKVRLEQKRSVSQKNVLIICDVSDGRASGLRVYFFWVFVSDVTGRGSLRTSHAAAGVSDMGVGFGFRLKKRFVPRNQNQWCLTRTV